MTMKNKDGNNGKRRNVTAHDRAMTDPEVQKVFGALRSKWNKLTPLQKGEQGEQLQKLVDSGCSVRGLERDLGEPASNIRRYLRLANASGEGSDRVTMLQRTLTKKFPETDTRSSRVADRQMTPKKIPAKPEMRPIRNQKYPGQNHENPSKTERINSIASLSSTTANESPVAKAPVTERDDRAREESPKMSLQDQYMLSRGPMTPEKMRLVAEIAKSFQRPPRGDARSMKRQGRPILPED